MHDFDEVRSALSNKFVIEKILGKGAMGTVYEGWDPKRDTKLAIKVFEEDFSRSLFDKEIAALSKLSHPNILSIVEWGEIDGLLYYATPLVEGDTLRHILELERQLPIDTALAICQAVAKALEAAHEKGFIHRDIKPANIIVPRKGNQYQYENALLTDFSVLGQLQIETGTTLMGEIFGTPTYMSPEQLIGEIQTPATDTYGLGLLLYEMLFGKPPFKADNLATLYKKIGEDQVSIPERPEIPLSLATFISKSLNKDPEERPASPLEGIISLRSELSEQEELTISMPARESEVMDEGISYSKESYSKKSFKPLLISICILLFIVLVGSLAFLTSATKIRWLKIDAVIGIFSGAALAACGIFLGLWLRSKFRRSKTEIQDEAQRIFTGAKSRKSLTESLAILVDRLLARCKEIDELFLGKSLALMVGQIGEAKSMSDQKAALLSAVEILEKLMKRLTPWYVRHDKLIAVLVSLVGIFSGIVKIVDTIMKMQ